MLGVTYFMTYFAFRNHSASAFPFLIPSRPQLPSGTGLGGEGRGDSLFLALLLNQASRQPGPRTG